MVETIIFDDLRLAQKGDQQALDRFLACLSPHLEGMAGHYAPRDCPIASSADLAQESALRIWQRLHQFRGKKDNEQTARMFWDWAGQIVRRLAFDHRREQNAQRRKPPGAVLRLVPWAADRTTNAGGWIDPLVREPRPLANARDREQARLIQEALDRISNDDDRTIIRLWFFEGLSFRQIAARLDLTYDRVRTGYHRSLRQLERELRDLL
jgi:RNA polymerase sigma factor (sigma-70 family)